MNNWTSWWSSGGKSTCQCRGHWFNFWSREDSSCLEATKPKWQLLMLKCPRAQCSVEKGATAMRGPHTTPRAQPLLAATTERAHTATQTQYRPKQTHLKEMKMEQYLDNQKCFLHVLGIRKPIIKKSFFCRFMYQLLFSKLQIHQDARTAAPHLQSDQLQDDDSQTLMWPRISCRAY